MKPFRLRRWQRISSPDILEFFTCGRPGRSGRQESKSAPVPDSTAHEWVRGLPGGNRTTIISLLGRKSGRGGVSEFSFYTFYGAWDSAEERKGKISFEDWLIRYHSERALQVVQRPTQDYEPIPAETLEAVANDVNRCLAEGRTVILVDSGGQERTGQVCRFMKLHQDSRSH